MVLSYLFLCLDGPILSVSMFRFLPKSNKSTLQKVTGNC